MNIQGVTGPGRNGVLPIFSRRKRPRQAIYVDPSFNGQSSAQQPHTGHQNFDHNPTERPPANSFNQYNSSKFSSLKKADAGSGVSARPGQMQQPTNRPCSTGTRQYAPPPLQHPRQNQRQLQNKGMYQAGTQKVDTGQRQAQHLGNTLRNNSNVSEDPSSKHRQQNFSNNTNVQPKGMTKQPAALTSNHQAANTSFGRHPFQQQTQYQKPEPVNRQQSANSTTAYGFANYKQSTPVHVGQHSQGTSARQESADENTGITANATVHNKVDHETDDIRIKPSTDDKSLRILTATIEGMIHWKQTTKLNLLFEIFGMVDSAVVLSKDGHAKEFVLRDGKKSIQCTFFEIDRMMPKATRGQWYRCVGNLNSATSGRPVFGCVSVRLATEQEKKLIKVNVAASDKAMRETTATGREP